MRKSRTIKRLVISIISLFLVVTFIHILEENAYADLDDGLVAYYPFNGNANDESGNGNNGVVIGASLAEDRFGNSNSAYLFNIGDYINCGNSTDFNIGTNFTVSVWINSNSPDGIIFIKKNPDSENKYLRLVGRTPLFYLFNTTGTSTTSGGSVPLNQWVHLAATYDGLNIKTYNNGVLVKNRSASGNVADSTADLGIARNITQDSGSFDGKIDDIRFYNRALSQSEILELYSSPILAIERTALIDFYNSTDGDNWNNNNGWKDPPLSADGFAMPGTEDSWYGISFDLNSVTKIQLRDNNLTGNLTSSISDLSILTEIWLGFNQLLSLPPEIGNLTNLTILELGTCQLTSLPSEIGNLSNLVRLDLDENQLESLPPEIGDLSNLGMLRLNGAMIKSCV